MIQEEFMARAIALAEKAKGKTSPNPMVGAVIVKGGHIIGEGFHRLAGCPHAEIETLKQVGANAEGGTLYVNLEPCCHHGRTPPCTEAILKAKINEVIIAIEDPNPQVRGKGIQFLKNAGIKVRTGVLETEARTLNEIFLKWITTNLPFITLKFAMTLDGKIASRTGDSKWITGTKSRERVHEMRSYYDAVLIGIGTLLSDDPLLTCRIPDARNPIRIILDSHLRTPPESALMKTAAHVPTWIVAASENSKKQKLLEKAGASVLYFPGENGKVNVRDLCAYLGKNNVTSMIVEGGAIVHGSFLEAARADKLAIFIGPKLIGNLGARGPIENWGKTLMREAIRLKGKKVSLLDEDILIEGYIESC